jgi:hypothetical protein
MPSVVLVFPTGIRITTRGGPLLCGQSVQDVPLQRVAVRHPRVVEVVGRIVRHPELSHDRP